ncbi:hypothetical protein FACS1894184_21400 [Clostridia bacterium]|nr:hypothetical protein FACS1894184_21400 [Clostridia bacterium]
MGGDLSGGGAAHKMAWQTISRSDSGKLWEMEQLICRGVGIFN